MKQLMKMKLKTETKSKHLSGLSMVLLVFCLLVSLVGCQAKTETVVADQTQAVTEATTEAQTTVATIENKTLLLSTTTSTENSGLLAYLLPLFTEETGIEVKVVAVGSGQALKMGEDGEADVLLVHAKASEEEFIAAGHGLERFDVMYNDFILVGPKTDALDLKNKAAGDINAAFLAIKEAKAPFVSRGDDSGTHKKELAIWKAAGAEITADKPAGEWYLSTGQGMGPVLSLTDEKEGYTLTDRATYLSMTKDLDLEILVENDKALYNQYGVIAVNPSKNEAINGEGAQIFIQWLLSEKGQALIGEFGKVEFGQSLFIPNAK